MGTRGQSQWTPISKKPKTWVGPANNTCYASTMVGLTGVTICDVDIALISMEPISKGIEKQVRLAQISPRPRCDGANLTQII